MTSHSAISRHARAASSSKPHGAAPSPAASRTLRRYAAAASSSSGGNSKGLGYRSPSPRPKPRGVRRGPRTRCRPGDERFVIVPRQRLRRHLRVGATGVAVWIFRAKTHGGERARRGRGVVGEETAGGDVSQSRHHLDRLERLHRSHHAGHGAQHAAPRATRAVARGGGGKHATVARRVRRRIGGRRRVPKPRAPGAAEHGELSLEADGGGGDERDTEDRARVREEVSRGDVIRAVEDDVGVSHEVERVAWGDAFEMCRDAASGVERADGGGAGDSLGRAAAGLGVDYLTVKIGQFDDVGVGEGEATDARAGEVERGGGIRDRRRPR